MVYLIMLAWCDAITIAVFGHHLLQLGKQTAISEVE